MTERTLANPFYAAVGAGDYALGQVAEAVTTLREKTEAATEAAAARYEESKSTATARYEETKTRLSALPEEVPGNIEELRGKLTADELRKIAEGYLDTATNFYNALAERGEEAVAKLRSQPLVQENLDRAEKAYNEAVDLTEDALGAVSTQTRAVGERAAKIATLTSSKIDEVGDAVEEAGVKFKEQAADAALEIDGAAGTVEGKARTANSSPAKKIAAAKKAPAKKAPAKKAPAKKAAPAAE